MTRWVRMWAHTMLQCADAHQQDASQTVRFIGPCGRQYTNRSQGETVTQDKSVFPVIFVHILFLSRLK